MLLSLLDLAKQLPGKLGVLPSGKLIMVTLEERGIYDFDRNMIEILNL
jgi:hypothetical protein